MRIQTNLHEAAVSTRNRTTLRRLVQRLIRVAVAVTMVSSLHANTFTEIIKFNDLIDTGTHTTYSWTITDTSGHTTSFTSIGFEPQIVEVSLTTTILWPSGQASGTLADVRYLESPGGALSDELGVQTLANGPFPDHYFLEVYFESDADGQRLGNLSLNATHLSGYQALNYVEDGAYQGATIPISDGTDTLNLTVEAASDGVNVADGGWTAPMFGAAIALIAGLRRQLRPPGPMSNARTAR